MGCLLVAHFTQLVVDSVSIPPWLSPHTALALAIKNPFHSKKKETTFGIVFESWPSPERKCFYSREEKQYNLFRRALRKEASHACPCFTLHIKLMPEFW